MKYKKDWLRNNDTEQITVEKLDVENYFLIVPKNIFCK